VQILCIFALPNKQKLNKMTTQTQNKLNLPKSYSTQDEAYFNGSGDNFFQLNDGSFICVSENDELYFDLINNGYKTLLQIYMEKYK